MPTRGRITGTRLGRPEPNGQGHAPGTHRWSLVGRRVAKRPGAPPETDPAAARRARVFFSGRPTAVEEWVTGEKIESRQSGDTWAGQLQVPPGDVRIVEIKLR